MSHAFVLSGPPGSGKSSLVAELQARGIRCFAEAARAVLSAERASGGAGIPEHDAERFCDLMSQRMLQDLAVATQARGPVVMDRGLPDVIGYRELFGLETSAAFLAAERHRYHSKVIWAPAWAEIYRTDDERKMSFEEARAFGDQLQRAYVRLGYELVRLPFSDVGQRADVVMQILRPA